MSQGLALDPSALRLDARPAEPVSPPVGYFQRTLPVALILGAFVVVTLPLTWLALAEPDSPLLYRLEVFYLITFGLTHFVITPTIYLQSSNLQFFNSSRRNRL